MCRLPLFIPSMVHFFMLSSIPISWLYILIVCIWVSNSFSFLVKKKVWCRPRTSSGWSFPVIYWVCNRLCISYGCGWVISWLSQIVMVIVHLNGICFFVSLRLLSFFLLLLISLSRFAWSSQWTVRLGRVFYKSCDSVVSSSGGIYRKLFCNWSRP